MTYNNFFNAQASSVKKAGFRHRSLFSVFMDLDFNSVHKSAQREYGQHPAILTYLYTWAYTVYGHISWVLS